MEWEKDIETLKRQRAFHIKIIVRLQFAPFSHRDGLLMLIVANTNVADFLKSMNLSVISVL